MAALKLYVNTDVGRFAYGPTTDNPLKYPVQLIQGETIQVNVYFCQPTNNPQSPWTVLNPSTFTNIGLWIGNSLTGTYYIPVTEGTIDSDDFGYFVAFDVALSASTITSDMGLALALSAILEIDWTSGAQAPKAQTKVLISRSLTITVPDVSVHKYTGSIGDGTNSVYIVIHSLNTKNISVTIRETATNGEIVATEIQIVDANTIQLTFGGVVASGQYQVTVIG